MAFKATKVALNTKGVDMDRREKEGDQSSEVCHRLEVKEATGSQQRRAER